MLGQRFYTIAAMLCRPSRLLVVFSVAWAALSLLGLASRETAAQALNGPPTVERSVVSVRR